MGYSQVKVPIALEGLCASTWWVMGCAAAALMCLAGFRPVASQVKPNGLAGCRLKFVRTPKGAILCTPGGCGSGYTRRRSAV